MRDSQSAQKPVVAPEHRDSAEAVVAKTESGQDTGQFRVVKVRSRIPGLGRLRIGRSRMGRWEPPATLFGD